MKLQGSKADGKKVGGQGKAWAVGAGMAAMQCVTGKEDACSEEDLRHAQEG